MSSVERPSNRQLFAVGKLQKSAMGLLLMSSVLLAGMIFIADMPLRLVAFLGLALVSVASVVFISRLAHALKSSAPWLYITMGFFPGLAQVALLILVIQSGVLLMSGGLRLGLFGVSNDDLEALRAHESDSQLASELSPR